jgi:hypothetical protein
VFALKRLTRRVEPALCDFLDSINVDFLHFGHATHPNLHLYLHVYLLLVCNILLRYRWMNCLLMRELNLECVLRLWDAYISEGERFPQFHVYVCVAFLRSLKGSIMGKDFPFVMKKLQVWLQPQRNVWQHHPHHAQSPLHHVRSRVDVAM